MRKGIAFLVSIILIAALAGCASTPLNPTDKAAYVAQARATLANASLGVDVAGTIFLALCATGDIPTDACRVGKSGLAVWDTQYKVASNLINQYEAGGITDRELIARAVAALMEAFIEIRHSLEGESAKAADKLSKEIKQIRAMNPDLKKPSGQKK
jgi:hypothetical protein